MSDDSIQIEIEDSDNAPDESPIAELTRQKAELQQRLSVAEQRATQAAATGYAQNLEAYINGAEALSASAKQQYQAAMESGDWKAASDSQEQLASAQAELQSFRQQKLQLEAQQRRVPADPVEAAATGKSKQAADWIRSHGDYFRDEAGQAKVMSAHYSAVAHKLALDSPEYFSHIEHQLGIKPRSSSGQYVKRELAPVAPASNGSGGGMSGGSRTVRLTEGQVRAATDGSVVWHKSDLISGKIKDQKLVGEAVGLQEYSRRLLQMKRDGRLDGDHNA